MEPMQALSNMPISFPGLFGDWEFNPDPKLLNIGNGVYWYGVLIATGVLLAILFCCRQAKKYGLTEDNVYDLALLAVPTCVIGSRIYYVVFYLDRFRNADGSFSWSKAIAIWDGGLAIYGTVIAAVIVLALYCWRKRIPFGAVADLGCMGLLIGQIIGRWGNFMNREAFGAETALPWRMRLWTSATEYIEVHPTFLYESLWNLVGLLLIVFVISKRRRFDGENAVFYFLWYGLGRFWIEGLRSDSLYLFGWTFAGQPIRVSQALSLLLFVGALLWWIVVRRIIKPDPAKLYVHAVTRQAAEKAEEVSPPAEAVPTTESVGKEAAPKELEETPNKTAEETPKP